MFEYSHYVDKKYPAKSSSPPPTDDTVVTPTSAAITYGNLMFNDYKSEELATQIMDVKLKSEGLQKERDFYYNKLRDIESFCRVMEDGYQDPTTTRILAIIYQTQEIRKVKKNKRRGGRKNKNHGPNEELEDYPPIDYPSTSGMLRN